MTYLGTSAELKFGLALKCFTSFCSFFASKVFTLFCIKVCNWLELPFQSDFDERFKVCPFICYHRGDACLQVNSTFQYNLSNTNSTNCVLQSRKLTLHNVQFVKYDVTVSFMAQVLDTVTYLVPQVLDTGHNQISLCASTDWPSGDCACTCTEYSGIYCWSGCTCSGYCDIFWGKSQT